MMWMMRHARERTNEFGDVWLDISAHVIAKQADLVYLFIYYAE